MIPTPPDGAEEPESSAAQTMWWLVLDRDVRRHLGGRMLLGGSPPRLIRLSDTAGRLLDGWLAGDTVEPGRPAELARQLCRAEVAHPKAAGGAWSTADVTLVVPVKDNEPGARRVLAASGVARRVIVDDGSAIPIVGASVRHTRPRGPAAARNAGWRTARTELVAFLDSDTEPQADWLTTVLPLFDDPQVSAVAPRVRTAADPSSPFARYESDRGSLDMGADPAVVRSFGRVGYVPSAALVVRRSALELVGGFDERLRFGEDVDLVWRLIDAGLLVRYEPGAVVEHRARTTGRAWLRQRFEYGTSAAPLALRHGERLCCARVDYRSALSWTALAAGRPSVALATTLLSTAVLPVGLSRHQVPTRVAAALALRGHLGAGGVFGAAVRRAWWPVALCHRTGRRILVASLLPCAVEAVVRHRGLQWLMLRLLDDLAYSAGVWAGCLRCRTLRPLLPSITGMSLRRRLSSVTLTRHPAPASRRGTPTR
ncbi:mycofactocin biosynthesis glycosyltransferase MftF [Nocardia sp. AB354]|uniref:mycofactocin biosynthesis glycosyltransferase MftF n=1 Tax=Nocardia sp. AB354 TaxID=3413283 RepID=UPI003C1EDA06